MDTDAQSIPATEADSAELQGWHRLGIAVRDARIHLGFSNREDFASACSVSVRVLADLEAGTRSNFSERILSRLESGLGWPPSTIDQVVTNADFVAPKPTLGGELLFRPPMFDRQPVQVEVVTVEKTIGLLSELSRELNANHSQAATTDALNRISAAVISLCWPYVIRLVEDNCLPGSELHPSVRPVYEAFLHVQAEFAPEDASGRYAQWLAGDVTDVVDTTRRRYLERWSESRRSRAPRRANPDPDN